MPRVSLAQGWGGSAEVKHACTAESRKVNGASQRPTQPVQILAARNLDLLQKTAQQIKDAGGTALVV